MGVGKVFGRVIKEILLLPVAPIRYPYKLLKLGAKGARKAYTWNKDRVSDNALEDLILIGMDYDGDEIAVLEEAILNKEAEIEQTKEKINKHHQDEASIDKKIAEGEAALEKMKSKKNIVGAVTVRAGKKYRVQKDLVANYKKAKKDYPNKLKNERANLKAQEIELKDIKKKLKDFKSNIRKEARKNDDIIRVVKYFYKNRDKFIERCHPDVVADIESEMQEIRDNKGNWPFVATPQEYLKSLKESIKRRIMEQEVEEKGEQKQEEPQTEPSQHLQTQSRLTEKAPRAQTTARTKTERDKDWQDFFRDEGSFAPDAFGESKAEESKVGSTKHYDKKTIRKLNDYMEEEILDEGDISTLNIEQEHEETIDDIIAEVKGETKLPTLEEQLVVAKEKLEKRDKQQSSKGGKHLTLEEKAREAKKEEQNARRREKRAEAKRIKEVNIQSLLKNRTLLIEAIENERTPSVKKEFMKELRDIEERLEGYGEKVEAYAENTSTIIDRRSEFLKQLKVEGTPKCEKAKENTDIDGIEKSDDKMKNINDGR